MKYIELTTLWLTIGAVIFLAGLLLFWGFPILIGWLLIQPIWVSWAFIVLTISLWGLSLSL